MFTLPFWIVFAICLFISSGVCLVYGRRAIHPRLRPHFGQVLVIFLILALVSFFIAVVLGKLIGGGMDNLDSKRLEERRGNYVAPPAPAPAPPSNEGQ